MFRFLSALIRQDRSSRLPSRKGLKIKNKKDNFKINNKKLLQNFIAQDFTSLFHCLSTWWYRDGRDSVWPSAPCRQLACGEHWHALWWETNSMCEPCYLLILMRLKKNIQNIFGEIKVFPKSVNGHEVLRSSQKSRWIIQIFHVLPCALFGLFIGEDGGRNS